MTSPDPFDDLEAELLALGDSLDVDTPAPADTAAAVRARLEAPDPAHDRTALGPAAGHAPGRRDDGRRGAARRVRRPRRWQVVTAAALAVVAVTAATPQGRAAVQKILHVAGIEVDLTTSTPSPVPTPTTLPGEHTVPPTGAAPKLLGPPTETRRSERVVSMFWPGGVRLDRIEGGLSPYFFKEVGPPWPDSVRVNGRQAWWIQGEHRLGYLRAADDTKIPLRLAGPTLIWDTGGTGYRLEGIKDRARAIQVAESLG